MNKFTLVANWDSEYEALGSLVYPRRQEYAQRHGYGCVRSDYAGHWGKISALLACWESSEWLFWLDIDATVTNMDVRLEQFVEHDRDMVIGLDLYGPNSGSFLVRTVPDMKRLLEECLSHREVFDQVGSWYDQSALAHLLWRYKDQVVLVPQRLFNSYPDYGRDRPGEIWQPGDFVLHCPGLPMDRRLELLGGV